MADPVLPTFAPAPNPAPLVPRTDPLAAGLATTEGKFAAVGVALGVLGTIAPALLELVSSLRTAYPQSALLATAASIAGMVLTALVATGYAKQRTALKVAALTGQAGFVQVRLLVLLACVAILVGCAGMKNDTVTASAGPHGGCVSSDAYVRLGNSQIECISACVSDQTGVQVTCRPISQPAVARTLVLPATTPETP